VLAALKAVSCHDPSRDPSELPFTKRPSMVQIIGDRAISASDSGATRQSTADKTT
jgi:hypothetical protein